MVHANARIQGLEIGHIRKRRRNGRTQWQRRQVVVNDISAAVDGQVRVKRTDHNVVKSVAVEIASEETAPWMYPVMLEAIRPIE